MQILKKYNSLILYILVFLLFKSGKVYTQNLSDFVKLNSVEIENYDEFKINNSFNQIFSNTKVIGIGEGTHGDKETQLFRTLLIKKLIGKYGFKIICLEESNNNVESVNEYIQGNNDIDIKSSVRKFNYWIWKTEEFISLIEWLKEFNKGQTSKISIAGVDTLSSSRDSIMAMRILQKTDTNEKVIFLAHNIHIGYLTPVWLKKQTGNHIKEKLNAEYYAIATLFHSGRLNAIKPPNYGIIEFETFKPKKKELVSKLADISENPFLLNIGNTMLNDFEESRRTWEIGAVFYTKKKEQEELFNKYFTIGKSFDGIFFTKNITPNKSLLSLGNYYAKVESKIPYTKLKGIDSLIFSFKVKASSVEDSSVFFFTKQDDGSQIVYQNKFTADKYIINNIKLTSFEFIIPIIEDIKTLSFGIILKGKGNVDIENMQVCSISKNNIKHIYNEYKLNRKLFDNEKHNYKIFMKPNYEIYTTENLIKLESKVF